MRSSLKNSRQVVDTRRSFVCDGNSITFGVGGSPYPDQLHALLPRLVVANVGVGGKTTQQLIDDFTAKVAPLYRQNAELVFFEEHNSFNVGGGNNTVAAEQILVQTYVSRAKSVGFKVWICTPPPSGDTAVNALLTPYSVWLRANHGFADGFIDLNVIPELTPPGITDNPTYFSDAVHLTSAGYGKLAAKVYGAVL